MYRVQANNLENLRNRTLEEAALIGRIMIMNVVSNFYKRIIHCQIVNCVQFKHFIVKPLICGSSTILPSSVESCFDFAFINWNSHRSCLHWPDPPIFLWTQNRCCATGQPSRGTLWVMLMPTIS